MPWCAGLGSSAMPKTFMALSGIASLLLAESSSSFVGNTLPWTTAPRP